MTLSQVTAAARAALAPPARHLFGIHPSVPADSISAVRAAYNTIIRQLLDPATARQALLDWSETLITMSIIVETLDCGIPQLQPHIDDMHRLAVELEQTGKVTIDMPQECRLYAAADVIDSIMQIAPHEVAIAAVHECEQLRRGAW